MLYRLLTCVIQEICGLFDTTLSDTRKFTLLAESRNKYGITPEFLVVKHERLYAMMLSAVSALVGYLDIVYGESCPDTLLDLFGENGITVYEYLALQLNASPRQEPSQPGQMLCGPTTLCQDLYSVALIYQFIAVEFLRPEIPNLVEYDRCMRLAAAYHRFSRGITATKPLRFPRTVHVERLRDPLAAVVAFENFVLATSNFNAGPLTVMDQNVQVRDAALIGILGGIAGGHRVTQVRLNSYFGGS